MTSLRYDYAWKTPGWTAQNPTFNGEVDAYAIPGMPADVLQVVVFGNFMEMSTGRPLEGVLRLRLLENLIHTTTGSLIPAGELTPVRWINGSFRLLVPATDQDELVSESGAPWLYQCALTVRGSRVSFEFDLPSILTSVNILDLMPTPDPQPEPTTGSVVYDGGAL